MQVIIDILVAAGAQTTAVREHTTAASRFGRSVLPGVEGKGKGKGNSPSSHPCACAGFGSIVKGSCFHLLGCRRTRVVRIGCDLRGMISLV